MKKILYLGPAGTFSQKAAIQAQHDLPSTELSPEQSLGSIAHNIGEDFGIMAYYNYLEGLVQETLDLIYEKKLYISGLIRVPITFYAGIYPGTTDHTEVYAHAKGLAQTSDWIQQNYAKARPVAVSSNAAAVQKVQDQKAGIAIAGKRAFDDTELQIIGNDIGNKKNNLPNFTDFYLVSQKANIPQKTEQKYYSMIAVTPHIDRPGLLAQILSQISFYDLNMAKIHSRPAIDQVDAPSGVEPQMFYIEIMCHQHDENFQKCIDALKYRLAAAEKRADTVRILGCYQI